MKKFQLTALILAAASLILIGIFTLTQNSLAGRLDTQNAASRWVSDGKKYAQLTAFISPYADYDASRADHSLADALDKALVDASITPENSAARLYAYAYSAEANVTMSRQSPETGAIVKSGVNATATGVGADFFLFHPLKLLSGQYFDTTDAVLNDQIVIDNNLAWQFFGSPDVIGYELLINGRRCYISGVCEADKNYSEFYGESGRVYMSYSLLSELNGSAPITCYELCMPDPVSGFALDILTKNLGVDEQSCEIVENSARFTDKGLFDRLSKFAERSVRQKLVAYPYWENAAVILVDRAAILYVFKLIPIVIIVLLIVGEIVLVYIKRKSILHFLTGKISKIFRDFRQNLNSKPKHMKPGIKPRREKLPKTGAQLPPLNNFTSDKERLK